MRRARRTSRACDFVIEAATESVELKVALLKKCDAALRPGKCLASNTSSISLTKLAGGDLAPRAGRSGCTS